MVSTIWKLYFAGLWQILKSSPTGVAWTPNFPNLLIGLKSSYILLCGCKGCGAYDWGYHVRGSSSCVCEDGGNVSALELILCGLDTLHTQGVNEYKKDKNVFGVWVA